MPDIAHLYSRDFHSILLSVFLLFRVVDSIRECSHKLFILFGSTAMGQALLTGEASRSCSSSLARELNLAVFV